MIQPDQRTPDAGTTSRWRTYAELVRLPNVFTAASDVLMGYLFVHSTLEPWWTVTSLVAASCLLYMAGMVLNDYFDFDIDRRERPHRPLPSGRMARTTAARLGWALLVLGVLLAAGAGLARGRLRTAVVAGMLAVAIAVYDGLVKRTPLAPAIMGACRGLNVLLGMSTVAAPWRLASWIVAAAMACYVTGITWFARREAAHSSRVPLIGGLLVMLCGLALWAAFPSWLEPGFSGQPVLALPVGPWRMLSLAIAASVLWRAAWAVVEPEPARIQAAVRHAILSLIMLDASVVLALRGWEHALPVALLVLPALFLGRWIYST